ncbi:MAG: MMPL family transporter, partial [Solirubrobacterales bacterium]
MLRAVSSFAAGRRSKWVILAVWVVLGVGLAQLQPQLQESTTNENEAFLPESADSTLANNLIEDEFGNGRELDAIVLYFREGGLTEADQDRIAADAEELGAEGTLKNSGAPVAPFPVAGEGPPQQAGASLPDTGPPPAEGDAPVVEFFFDDAEDGPLVQSDSGAAPEVGAVGPSLVSEDGSTALLIIPTFSEDSDEIQENTEVIKEIVPPSDADGLQAYLTGTVGFVSDSIEVFESIDLTLLLVTITLVLVLLLIIYRSIVIALVPIIVVGIA